MLRDREVHSVEDLENRGLRGVCSAYLTFGVQVFAGLLLRFRPLNDLLYYPLLPKGV